MPTATAPTRTGYTFTGYWDATTGGIQYYTNTMASSRNWDKTANTTLYAGWTIAYGTVESLSIIEKQEAVSVTGVSDGSYTQYYTDGTGFIHNISAFTIGKYEVTYELWYTVRQWAISNGYTFANAGKEGNDGTAGAVPTTAKYEPVTTVNWRDTIVWCNAYSEMSGLTPCYSYSSTTIKDSQDTNATACDGAVCDWSANGYRLPSEGEWQYAASAKGATPYNYASGATTFYNDIADVTPANGVVDGKDTNDAVAVYYQYWNGSSWVSTGVTKTAEVGTKTANALGIQDMSGNVFEWSWDWYGSYPTVAQSDYKGVGSGSARINRGGSYSNFAVILPVGYRDFSYPFSESINVGFRIARTN